MYIYENKSTKKRIEWKVVLSYIKKKENCNNWQPCFSQPGANMTPPVITPSNFRQSQNTQFIALITKGKT